MAMGRPNLSCLKCLAGRAHLDELCPIYELDGRGNGMCYIKSGEDRDWLEGCKEGSHLGYIRLSRGEEGARDKFFSQLAQ